MEDTSSASTDGDIELLTTKSNSDIGTQTPEMPKHEIKITEDVPKSDQPTAANKAITVYKLDTQKPLSELEKHAKSLAIPDVVVEYIKESIHRDANKDQEQGKTNLAFEPQELIIVRSSSSISLREDAKRDASLGIGKNNPLYYSLRPDNKKADASSNTQSEHLDVDDPSLYASSNTQSQGTTPRMEHLGVDDPSLYASSSSLGYPRSVPPSPNFGYRPLESESSEVYTIIAPVKYLGGANEKKHELKLLAELRAQLEHEKKLKRKFEFVPAPVEVERRRERLQCCTDACSTMFLIPGLFIAIFTPLIIIPMFLFPLKYYIPLILVFMVSGIVSVLALAMSGLVGNIVWHFDPDKRRLRPRMHCGRGPLLHFWGNGFYPSKEDKRPLTNEKIV